MDCVDVSRFYRSAIVVMLGLTVFSCSGGGGCSSCEGCGVQPIPGGYVLEERIPNAAQARLTSSGISFIEDNISGIVATFLPEGLDFPVERQTVDFGISFTICDDNDCSAHIEIDSIEISPTDPNLLRAHLRLILDSRNRAGSREEWSGTCDLDIDSRRGGRQFVGVNADIRLVGVDASRPARGGYTQVVVESIALADGEGIEDDDIDISGGFAGSCGLLNLGFIKNFIIGQVEDQISGLADGAIGDNLCTTRGEFGCPTGTFAVPDEDPDSTCRFGPSESDECVPILIGMDGQGDLGGTLLGGFSPGTHAYAQFVLAAGGDGQAVNEGMTVDFFGGFRGTNRDFTVTPAHNSCVPMIEPPPRPTIAQAAAFRGNTIPGTTMETHVGIGIAESYMDYAGYGMFDSGMLCLGAGTRLSQQLSTGLVSAAIMSLPDLTFPNGASALTIAVRPQTPPDFSMGAGGMEDPLLQIALNQLDLDFYVWSQERYVRFMTFRTDLTIGIDLSVEGNQLVPTIRYVSATNSSVSNSELLAERPEVLAGTLEAVIQGFAGMLTSGLSPFDLPEIMGFELEVPPAGITRVTEGDEAFLGIFANLRLASGAPVVAPVETSLELSDLSLDRESMHPEHWDEGEGNSVWLHITADGPLGVEYEYSYRIDGGPWSAWTRDSRILVGDEILLLQARHEIEARARVAGEPASTDETPASSELLVDILPPTLQVARTADGVRVIAEDVITAQDDLVVRYLVDGAWTEWSSDFDLALPYDGSEVSVEVRDEAGNVGRSVAPLIRGLPDGASADGCGCSAPGGGKGLPITLLALLGVLGVGLARRRARGGRASVRPFFLVGALALAAFATGCDCTGQAQPCGGTCGRDSVCCETQDMCVDYDPDSLCEPGFECTEENIVTDAMCGVSCSMCTVRPALQQGIMATYLDAIVDDSGNVFVSGYSPGVAMGASNSNEYGDLVFGAVNGPDVTWDIVDGAPSMPITNDPSGWRDGVSDPGPDVGRWTSLAQAGGVFYISYYDVDAGALKLATGTPDAWETHTVDDAGDSGRYSSLVITPAGVPVIAYLRIQESPTMPGQVMGSVMVATASVATPASETDWTITEVASGAMPCRAEFCESAPACIEDGVCVTPTSDCPATCASGDVCFNGSCHAEVPRNYVEDMPPAYGLYTSLAVDPTGGLALVYYDRTTGNLYGVRNDGAAWGAPFWIDGYLSDDPFVGDSGQGADLTVDSAGLWHVAYIDGAEETLRYAQVQSTGVVLTREVVDDGSTDGTARHTDGRHIIGDDASIVVLEGGGVRVAYQDSTSQDTMMAVRPPGGGAWAIVPLETEATSGFWVEQELLGTTSYVVTLELTRDGRTLNGGVRVITSM